MITIEGINKYLRIEVEKEHLHISSGLLVNLSSTTELKKRYVTAVLYAKSF